MAVKLFRLDLPPERVHQLVAEFERLIGLNLVHPAMAAPVVAGISGVSAYLAQEFVAADSADIVLRDHGPASASDVARVATELAGALDVAAAAGVSHGALHPRDVLVGPDQSRLTGLGVAQARDRVGITAAARRPYTAPERLAGDAWDRRADIFSLAAVIYEMLSGKRIAGTGAEAADALPDVPGADKARLRNVFARALAERPGDRYKTALSFAEALGGELGRTPEAVAPKLRAVQHKKVVTRVEVEAEPLLPLDPQLGAESEAAREFEPDLQLASPIPEPSGAFEESLEQSDDVPNLSAVSRHTAAPVSPSSPSRNVSRDVWPLALAVGIGLAVGFAGGYGVASRDGVAQVFASAAGAAAPVAAAAPPPVSRPRPVPEPAVAKPAAVAVGRILVRSTPPGAAVTIDGQAAGSTPTTRRELEAGTHVVRVSREGYAAEQRRVTITSARPSQSLTIAMARERRAAQAAPSPAAPTSGRVSAGLLVDSRPPGASVFVDNRLVGTTPLTLSTVSAGEHAVRLERDGYRQWTSSVHAVAGEQNRVTASLER